MALQRRCRPATGRPILDKRTRNPAAGRDALEATVPELHGPRSIDPPSMADMATRFVGMACSSARPVGRGGGRQPRRLRPLCPEASTPPCTFGWKSSPMRPRSSWTTTPPSGSRARTHQCTRPTCPAAVITAGASAPNSRAPSVRLWKQCPSTTDPRPSGSGDASSNQAALPQRLGASRPSPRGSVRKP